MDWTALVYVLVILVIIISLLVMRVWPRHSDGSPMSFEEVEELMEKFPRPPSDPTLIMMIFTTLILIGVALTR